jgi:hypothetical protein
MRREYLETTVDIRYRSAFDISPRGTTDTKPRVTNHRLVDQYRTFDETLKVAVGIKG